jgi:oligopeptide transport system ATP-binding protein
MIDQPALLEVRNLVKHFPVRRGVLRRQVGAVRAVDGVSFHIHHRETLGLVGESGSGKSTLARTILRLFEPSGGRVIFDGEDIIALDAKALRRIRPRMQMVFQDPYASLNPRMTAGATIMESLQVNRVGDASKRPQRVRELLDLVGLAPKSLNRYPHEFSGGQRQRISIARALAADPEFIVADEALSALDVSIQAQMVNLLQDLKDELGLTYLFIAHDLAMVRYLADRTAVMYLGRIAELADSEELAQRPMHPYTLALLSAAPIPDPVAEAKREHIVLPGDVPDPGNPPSGCRFHTRCSFATPVCQEQEPQLRDLGTVGKPHLVACHHAEKVRQHGATASSVTQPVKTPPVGRPASDHSL